MSKFRLQLKMGKVAPGPAEAFLTERPNKEKPAHTKDKKNFESTGKVQKCHAFLQAFQSKPTQTNTFGTKKIYAIIGQGFAATTNLATLRSSYGRDRVNGMHVLVIGLPDPWQSYVSHNMNQEVELLTLPGYANRPDLPEPKGSQRWLNSREFAKVNEDELKRAVSGAGSFWPSLQTLNARVTWIDKQVEKGQTRYVIHFEDRKSIKACRVDVCTGTGQQTYAEAGGERGINMSRALWDEYLNPTTLVNGNKPRVISAEMYVAGGFEPISGGSVLVTSANSPAGIQAGEHALCKDGLGTGVGAAAELVLIASAKMNGGFPPIGRLDDHARTSEGPLPRRLHHPLAEDLYPTHGNVWFGEDYRISAIEELTDAHRDAFAHVGVVESEIAGKGSKKDKRLLVTFAPGKSPRFVRGEPLDNDIEAGHTEARLAYGLFDQVVISTGRSRGGRSYVDKDKEKHYVREKDEGSALQMVWSLRDDLEKIKVSGYDFPVGLATKDGQLRILGAAGINNPIYQDEGGETALKDYENSLPWQARVNSEGVTLAAKTIALANHYFKVNVTHLNASANTATLDELKRLLGKADLAKQIFDARHWRVRPFQSGLEILRVLEYHLNVTSTIVGSLSAEETLAAIEHINDTAALLDEVGWEGLKADVWQPTPFGQPDLEDLLMRYANHINDAKTRVKITVDTP